MKQDIKLKPWAKGKRRVKARADLYGKGSNATHLRRYNERVVLNAFRRLREASRAEVARYANLTPTAIAAIMDSLEADGYIEEIGRRFGNRGQPSILYRLAHDRAFGIGIRIGRKTLDALLIDFSGAILRSQSHDYDCPEPRTVKSAGDNAISSFRRHLGATLESRIAGLGLAVPYFIGGWTDELGFPSDFSSQWNGIDLQSFLSAGDIPNYIENDASAAALAETMYGVGNKYQNFLVLHIDTFIGGGLIQNGQLHTGANGNSAAIGPFPVSKSTLTSVEESGAPFETLVRRASLYVLFNHLKASGVSISKTRELNLLTAEIRKPLAEWIEDCAEALAETITGVSAVIDVEAIAIGGDLPDAIAQQLIAKVKNYISSLATPGLVWPDIVQTSVGQQASAIGAATLPFYNLFSPDSSVLVKKKLIKRAPVDLNI